MDQPGITWQSRMGNNADGIGGNAHLYGITTRGADGGLVRRRLLVDYGIKFGGGGAGYSAEFASPAGLLARRDGSQPPAEAPPEALLLTHAHEDHLGALRHVLDMGFVLPPVYCTAFTAQMAAKSLVNAGIPRGDWPEFNLVKPGQTVELAGARIEFVPMDHLPGASALHIRSGEAAVFHTGDYKFDGTLPLGERADPARLRAIGDMGIDMVVSDSTSAASTAQPVPESEICRNLTRLLADCRGRQVVAGLLGTQLDRLVSLGRAASANDRVLVVRGQGLEQNLTALAASGVDIEQMIGAEVLTNRESQSIPASRKLVVTTGAFGQENAGLGRAAAGLPGAIPIDDQSVVIIPQRAIPAVAHAQTAMIRRLERRGATVISAERAIEAGYGPIHQSGHALEKDTRLLYSLLRPRGLVAPMHGNGEQLDANAKIARSLGIPCIALKENGSILAVDGQGVHPAGTAPIQRIGAHELQGVAKKLPRAKPGQARPNRFPAALYRYDALDAGGRKRLGTDLYPSAAPRRTVPVRQTSRGR